MADVDYVLLISRWVHIVSAIVAIGGAAFSRFALQPGAQEALDDAQHARLREAVRARWSKFVHICITLLLITGVINFVILAIQPKIEPMPYHAIFTIKVLAALGVFFLGSALAGRSSAFAKLRQDSRKWLGVLLVLAFLIVLLSGLMSQVRSHSTPPGDSAALKST